MRTPVARSEELHTFWMRLEMMRTDVDLRTVCTCSLYRHLLNMETL